LPNPQNPVLIVDDEEANRLLVRRLLEQAGWSAIEAADGIEAVDAARRAPPALVIMDIDMPRCDGFAATQALRDADPPLSGVPILVYSATSLSDAEISRRGMDGRIPKPCTYDQLIAAIEPWLRGGQLEGAQRLAGIFGEAELSRLIAGLREQLVSAVEEMKVTAIPTAAHRIAGVAGTLGFADVSASWLALSDGDESVRDRARRDARLAIAAIDRGALVAPHH
jgi:CheY-like chemotaxis protein